LRYEQGTFGYQVKCLQVLRSRHGELPPVEREAVGALRARFDLLALFV
jgi:hypothetical protein